MNKKIAFTLALVFSSPSLAQGSLAERGRMPCADYVKAVKNSPNGSLGASTGSAEADAEIAKLNNAVLKVCTDKPNITVREALQEALPTIE